MSIKLMPKFRKHATGAAEPAAPKTKKAATNAPIQISVGKRGAKKWRKGNGPWQYGEPPKPDKPAKKTSAEMKDPVLRKDHSEQPKEKVSGSVSKGTSSGLMAKMKVTKQTPPEDGKGTIGSKPNIDPIAAAKLKEVPGSFVVGEKPNRAVASLLNKLDKMRAPQGALNQSAVDRAVAHVENNEGFKDKKRITPYQASDGIITHTAKDLYGGEVHLGRDRWGSTIIKLQPKPTGEKKAPVSGPHHEEVQKFLQRIPADAHPEVAAYLNKKATKMSEAVRKNEEAYAKASKEDRSAWSPKPGAQTTKWIQTTLEQARRQASEAQRLFKAGNPTARSYLD